MRQDQIAKPSPFDAGRVSARPTLAGVSVAVLVLVATIVMARIFRGDLPEQSLPLLFLLAVLVVAISYGFWTGILASIAAFVAYNYFLIEPLYTLRVAKPEDALALAVLLASGATTGFLAGRARDEAEIAKARADMLGQLARFSGELSHIRNVSEAKQLVIDHLAAIDGANVVLLEPQDDQLAISVAVPRSQTLLTSEIDAAARAFRRGIEQPRTLEVPDGNRYTFAPLGPGLGVVGVAPGPRYRNFGQQADQLRRTILQQSALAIERLKLEGEAQKAEAKAHREGLRAALLSSLSHDLRTPLATILGGTTSLRELGETLSPSARAELLDAMEQETRRLSRYVDNLLDLTRLKSGLDIRRIAVDASDVVQGAVERARRAFAGRPIAVRASGSQALILADAVLLEQAIFNVLDNAVKFSQASTPVDVQVEGQPSSVDISIFDRGTGIDPTALAHVFEPFVRGEPARTTGSGLGLTIARGIAEALGGTLTAESPGPEGIGTVMRFTLPRSPS